ncbi:MAG TPA: hypothetical protein VM053_05605 [Gemmatimonadaceae bacterium]|nr:hypothetical protein [Gemmatimonadaceae bacterium]
MKKQILTALAAVTFGCTVVSQAALAQGVDPQCPPGTTNSQGDPDNTKIAQDACQKAIDLFKYLAPQLGAVLAGGSPTQGISGTLGGPGHFSFGVRANALRGSLPQVDRVVPNTRGAQSSTYGIDDTPVGFITADLGIGLFSGLQNSGFGALDVLASASYLPSYKDENVDITEPSGSFKFGFGAKLGILRESPVRPGISVSYLDRALPDVTITGKSGDDRLVLDNLSVRARSWRAIAGKSFMFLGIGAGGGQDFYDSNADITVTIAARQATQGGTGGPIALSQKLTRTNFFGTAWLNARVFRLVGEIGRVSGGTIVTYNQFDGPPPADARTYASVGFSFGR